MGERVGRRVGGELGAMVGLEEEGVDGEFDEVAVGVMGLDEIRVGVEVEGEADWKSVGEGDCSESGVEELGEDGAAVVVEVEVGVGKVEGLELGSAVANAVGGAVGKAVGNAVWNAVGNTVGESVTGG